MVELDFLIKIGGSILTDKHQQGIINHDLIIEICKVLKKLYDRKLKFAIITGVGSLGHQTVAKYSVHKGDNGSNDRRLGLLEAQIAVNKLRNIFLQALLDAEIPAFQFYTSSIAKANKMKPTAFYLDSVSGFINYDLIPIVSGDVVYDEIMGYSVMSGDIAFSEIFKQWKPKLLIYGTDVKGIFTDDPEVDKNAKLIPIINSKMIQDGLQGITEGVNVDVSGAMKGKFQNILSMLQIDQSIKVHIISLKEPKNLLKLLNNEPFEHTIIQS